MHELGDLARHVTSLFPAACLSVTSDSWLTALCCLLEYLPSSHVICDSLRQSSLSRSKMTRGATDAGAPVTQKQRRSILVGTHQKMKSSSILESSTVLRAPRGAGCVLITGCDSSLARWHIQSLSLCQLLWMWRLVARLGTARRDDAWQQLACCVLSYKTKLACGSDKHTERLSK